VVSHKSRLLRGADAHGVEAHALLLELRAPPLQLDEELLAEGSPKTPQERDDGDALRYRSLERRSRAVGREEGQVADHRSMAHRLRLGRDVPGHDLAAAISLCGGERRRDAPCWWDERRSLRQRQR